jgi:hypothetical protein
LRAWLLLSYKIPPKPTAGRVYVWRKLKRLGAILLHDAVWVLPSSPRTLEQFQWLAAEIGELSGEALVWESHPMMAAQDETLVQQFVAQTDAAYQKILTALKRKGADLAALSRQYQQISTADYFQSELGVQVREALVAARGDAEA